MEPILYWFPIVYHDDDNPENDEVVQENGKIIPCQLDHEPYEAMVETYGYSFHIIFGHQTCGMFLCIPNWEVGCELSTLSDRHWNIESMMRTEALDYECSTAIAWALSSIDTVLSLIH